MFAIRRIDHLCPRIEPFDAAKLPAYLREKGIDMSEVVPRHGAEGEGPSVYLSDPEANTVELKGPPRPV